MRSILKLQCQDGKISGNEPALVSKQNRNQQKVMFGGGGGKEDSYNLRFSIELDRMC